MIEENFGELDSDFLKVWSQFLLDGDWSAHAKNLEKLAELGQINAIAEYFRANPENVNPIIAKNLNSNASENFNVLYAKALQKQNEETKNGVFSTFLNKYKKVCNELDNEDFLLRMNVRDLSDLMRDHDSAINQKKILEEQIKSYEFVELLNRAAASCFKAWKDTQNPVFLENFCEMGLKHRDVMFGQNRSAVDFLGTARRFLWRAFCRDIRDLPVKFSYGKNMMQFSKGEKERREGEKFLRNVTTVKFSDTLKNYKIKGDGGKE